MNMLDSHIKQLKEYYEKAKIDPENALNAGYHFVKEIAHYYYDNDNECMNDDYKEIQWHLRHLERRSLSYHNILDFHCLIDTDNAPSKEDVLDYIVYCGRKHLIDTKVFHVHKPIEDLYNWNFRNDCYWGSSEIANTCSELGIKCRMIIILPGFGSKKEIPSEYACHWFNIIEFESKKYLVDITLAQFFDGQNNHPGRLGVANFEGPSVGCYMTRLNGGEEIARKLFTVGYVELTDEVFKTYMDAFMLSFRNGLYYEENGIILPYSIDQYMQFLHGEDSQVKHEKVYCLGKQRRPLKNPNMSIFDKIA